MLRIQRDEMDARTAVLLLQGRIALEWADLLERECRELTRSGFRVVLDFSDVVFIGRTGLEALGRLGKAGVGIVGCSPLLAAMLEQEGIVGGTEFQVDGVETPRSLRLGDSSGDSVPPSTVTVVKKGVAS